MNNLKMNVKDRKSFRTCDNKGFHITFPNGVTLSTQFGYGNYCENYNFKEGELDNVFAYQREHGMASNDCEIMMCIDDGNPITTEWSKNEDTVQGRVSMDQWLCAFDFCRNYRPPLRAKE